MATALVVGDIAILHYNTSTDAFSFVFLRDVEAGTEIHFTDNGWIAAGGFRGGESTVTYAAPSAVTAGTIVTLSGLLLAAEGDQIIAYQGDPATPTILHLIDFGDGNNTVEGDAIDAQTTALPLGFTLGVNAVAVAFDQALYAGPTSGSPEGLFTALNNSANWLDEDALPVGLIANKKPTIDLDSDNSTDNGLDYETSVASSGPAVPIADTDIAIDDDDDFEIFFAEIKVNGRDPRDLLTVNGSLPTGIFATAYDPATGILKLSGQATHADYEAAIRHVEFSTTDAPNQTKRILVSVHDGNAWSKEGTAFIHVSANLTAAPPGLDLDANNSSGGGADATATYTAGGPPKPVTDIDVLITDADSTTIQLATITILGWARNPGDLLSVGGSLPGGITASSYNPSTGVLTLSGPASLADYQTALHQVVYSNTLAAPSTADRGIQVTVNDGTFESNLATMYMHVAVPPPNIAPVLDLDANNSTTPDSNYLTGFTEGGPPVAIADADVSIIDSDSPSLASATITLTNPQAGDALTFDGLPPTGISVSGSGTTLITITGGASSVSYQTALQQIKFSNGNIDPSNVTRTIEVVVNDGASNSNIATAVVQVEAVNNSAPVIDLDPDDSGGSFRTTFRTTFTENGAPLPIADADTTITDLDSTTLVSATITLANRQTGDLLTATPSLPGGIVASAYDPATGVLVLAGVATLDLYESALRQVLYSNTSDDPVTVDRLIEVVVSDGANTSNVAAALVSVVAVNDAPALHVDTPAAYFENASGSVLSPLAVLTDVDDAELSEAVVRITGGTIPGDGDTLTVGGFTNGTINGITFLWDAAEHALVLTGASSVANYQQLLQTVAFHSTSDNPTDFNASSTRTLTWSASDGTAVTIATTTLNIVVVNDAPQATAALAASYTENGAPVALSPTSTVTDVDDITLVAGEVRIVSGAVDGDLLTVNGLQSGTFSGIDFSYDSALRSLTFTRPAAVADYEAFLQAVAFSSTSDNPTSSGLNPTRTLSWFVFDGDALSDAQTTILLVTALPDPPVNTVPGPQAVDEDTALPIAGVSVADVDSTSLTTTLTVVSGTLSVTAGLGVTGNGSAAVTITGTATEINTALAGLSYTGIPNFNGVDTLTVTTDDGSASPDIDTVAITVSPVNDPPINTVPSAQSVNEDANRSILGLAVVDADAGVGTVTATLTVVHGILTVASAGGAGVFGSGTGTVTLTGTVSQINTTLAAANNVIYRGVADYNGPDTLTLTSNDGGNTGLGGALTDIDAVAITVNAVNDRPVLDLDANNSSGAAGTDYTTIFTEGGAAVAVADLDDLIADVDNPNLASATITLANHQPADLLGVIGALPAGITSSAYDPATGVLTLSGTATLAAYQTALRQITFSNSSPVPSATDRIINIVVNDGAASSFAAHAFIHVVPVDTAPALDLDADDSSGLPGADYTAVFTGGGTAVPIADADTLIADADSSNILSATITLTNAESTDFLLVNGTLPTGITGVFDPPTGTLTLSGSAPLAVYQAALQQIEFDSSVPIPLTATRVIEVVVNDGLTASDPAFSLIQIALAAPPTLDLDADDSTAGGSDYATTFTEDGAAVTIADTDIAISMSTLVSATITLTNLLPGDLLSVSGTLPVGVTAVYDPGTGVMTLTGEASAAAYQAVSDQIVYSNTTENPATDDRIITVVVNDGINDSNTATAIVKVAAVNDPPSLSVAAAASYTENDVATLVSPIVAISDPDSSNLTIGIVTITAGLNPGDVLTVSGLRSGTLGPVTFNWAPSLNELIVTGAGSLDDYEALFQSVRFLSDSDDPTNAGTDATRIISWAVFDGTSTAVSTTTLTISGVNDAPVAQDGSAIGNEDSPITGTLVATDVDSPTLTYSLGTSTTNGIVVVNPDGSYAYTPNGDFNGADSFTFTANDGTADSNTATISLTVELVNDAPVAQDSSASGNEDTPIGGTLVATDVDSPSLTYSLGTQAAHGTAVVNPGGSYTYTPNADFNGTDSFTFTANDGIADSNSAMVNLSVDALNDVPVNTVPGTQTADVNTDKAITGLSIDDVDAGAGTMTTMLAVANGTLNVASAGGAAVAGSGTDTVVLAGTLAQINTTLAAANNVIYRGLLNFAGTDTLTITSSDGGNSGIGGILVDTDQVTINFNAPIHRIGTPQDDTFTALPDDRIDALRGYNDTISFGFALVEAAVSWAGNQVIIDGPGTHAVLTGFEIYVFTDGTVNNNDGDALVDDLFYYSQYHDVWNAHIEADQHYHASGWHEGRDPSAFFNTALYLSANPDVNASGVDPLIHYDKSGWIDGRIPSLTFDGEQYLAAYPDVAASNIDPLEHFLRNGAQELRQPFAPSELIAANGFDYVYYLQHNPDVAAAHVDPFEHFETNGWHEGRNPNALFDTNGYLATYTDVAAAGVNPLDHYHLYGWAEGRDPSVDFDTADYLSHYPDVSAAHIDPLKHFLEHGIHEGRSPFADGVWG